MEFIATQKYILISPKKARLVAELAVKMKPLEAIEKLTFTNKRAALPLVKVIKSAVANAKAKGASEETLIIKEIQINEGPRLKRGIPVSRGQWHPIKKRMSHFRVVLSTPVQELPNTRKEKKEEDSVGKIVDKNIKEKMNKDDKKPVSKKKKEVKK